MATDFSRKSPLPDGGKSPQGFFSQAQLAVRKGIRQRFLWATLVALLGLAVLILMGPDQQSIQKKFEYYGAPGELRIMPVISIEKGHDKAHQLPRSLQKPPPPNVVEIPEENATDTGFEPVPKPRESLTDQPQVDQPVNNLDIEVSDRDLVELNLPQQSSRDFYILNLVRPEYPLNAPLQERKTPVITVTVAVFLEVDGKVSHSMITATDGSQVYSDAVLAVVDQWQFAWRITPTAGRWIKLPWNFLSPFYTQSYGGHGS